jgi:hypothetical protein
VVVVVVVVVVELISVVTATVLSLALACLDLLCSCSFLGDPYLTLNASDIQPTRTLSRYSIH